MTGRAAAGAALALAALACGSPGGGPRGVEIAGFAYAPDSVVVRRGETVLWRNRDLVPHTATGEAGAWDTGTLAPGDSASWTPTRPGTNRYLCTLHPTMRGVLVVH